MWQKHYPDTVRLRRGFLGVAGGFGLVLVLWWVHNLQMAKPLSAPATMTASATQLATPLDVPALETPPKRPPLPENLPSNRFPLLPPVADSPSFGKEASSSAQATMKAMSAPIGSNEIKQASSRNSSVNTLSPATPSTLPPLQTEAFLRPTAFTEDTVSKASMAPSLGPYVLNAGTFIPGILLKALNSDLPDTVVGQVQENVYDSLTGHYLLIPQGTKVLGTYNAHILDGQSRLQVVWTRLLFPNGSSLPLGRLTGDDRYGQAGFRGNVNHHYGALFGAALLTSVLSAGAQLSQPRTGQTVLSPPSVNQVVAQSVGTSIANAGTLAINKALTVPPTITIPEGYAFHIQLRQDIVFAKPYEK